MTLTQNVPDEVFLRLSDENLKRIEEYWADPYTATTFSDSKDDKKGDKNVLTAEVIYYQMIAFNIPFECQRWHISRLQTLIRVCSRMNSNDKKKMSLSEISRTYDDLNERRKKALGTKG